MQMHHFEGSESETYQVHANVNVDHRDAALRVSITFYDESGHQIGHRTWRKHVRRLSYDGMEWSAYSATVDLAKMMGEVCQAGPVDLEHPEEPLPGL